MGASLINIHRSQTSFSEDAVLTTNYLDDNIIQGRIFSIGISVNFTADTPVYFTSEVIGDINSLFLLPISINPTTGYITLNIYEETEYTGGDAVSVSNRNRPSDITPSTSVKSGATGTEKGTLLSFTQTFGSIATGGFFGGSSGGGAGSSSNAIVLDTDKKYLFELTSSETGMGGINAEFGEV